MNRASSATGWVRNPDGTLGWTWNPITGCLNHTPEGLCLGGMFPCYAFKLANGRLKSRYLANFNIIGEKCPAEHYVLQHYNDPFYPRFWPERIPEDRVVSIKAIEHTKSNPKGIFVCDMGELFGDWIPQEWQEEIFRVIRFNPWHRFYLLTKQPQNLIKFSPFPDNCWVGVTATNWDMAFNAFWELQDVKVSKKYISFEPLLDSMNHRELEGWLSRAGVNWVIIGAQTKPYKPPAKIWVDEIIEACKKANIPYFLKDNLQPLLGDNLVQELPKGVEIVH